MHSRDVSVFEARLFEEGSICLKNFPNHFLTANLQKEYENIENCPSWNLCFFCRPFYFIFLYMALVSYSPREKGL